MSIIFTMLFESDHLMLEVWARIWMCKTLRSMYRFAIEMYKSLKGLCEKGKWLMPILCRSMPRMDKYMRWLQSKDLQKIQTKAWSEK